MRAWAIVAVVSVGVGLLGCEQRTERTPVPVPVPVPVVVDAVPVVVDAVPVVVVDAVPVDARPKVARIACPSDADAIDDLVRSRWGPPADDRAVTRCAAAVMLESAWVVWGTAKGAHDAYQIRISVLRATGDHAVIAERVEQGDAMDTDSDFNTYTIEAVDLDGDGSDELLWFHYHQDLGVERTTLRVIAVRAGQLLDGTELPYAFDDHAGEGMDGPGTICTAKHAVVRGPPPRLQVTGRTKQGSDGACAVEGRHLYRWDAATLTLAE